MGAREMKEQREYVIGLALLRGMLFTREADAVSAAKRATMVSNWIFDAQFAPKAPHHGGASLLPDGHPDCDIEAYEANVESVAMAASSPQGAKQELAKTARFIGAHLLHCPKVPSLPVCRARLTGAAVIAGMHPLAARVVANEHLVRGRDEAKGNYAKAIERSQLEAARRAGADIELKHAAAAATTQEV